VKQDVTGEIPADARTTVLFRDGSNPAIRTDVSAFMRLADECESWLDNAIGGVASSLVDNLESAPGDVIGSYRIVTLLGRGGMGSVYLAERSDGEIEQKVAIKLLRAGGLRPEWRDRFLRERQLLASLHHPSIVHVVDAGHTDDRRPFLVME